MKLTENEKSKLKEIYKEAGLKPVKVTSKNASRAFGKYRKEF